MVVGCAATERPPSGGVGARNPSRQALFRLPGLLEVLRIEEPLRQLRLRRVPTAGVLVGEVDIVDAADSMVEREALVGEIGLCSMICKRW